MTCHKSMMCVHADLKKVNFYLFIYFIYFQVIYRWQILFQLTIRLAFHKQARPFSNLWRGQHYCGMVVSSTLDI